MYLAIRALTIVMGEGMCTKNSIEIEIAVIHKKHCIDNSIQAKRIVITRPSTTTAPVTKAVMTMTVTDDDLPRMAVLLGEAAGVEVRRICLFWQQSLMLPTGMESTHSKHSFLLTWPWEEDGPDTDPVCSITTEDGGRG
jgi:hypothetical protein